ncbi:aquaporin-9 [Eurytemora carolleeae]|uniref:aquaporin-9 n=1 Tax=Eurytemora carolleeae TaxID=1294199 RepID=UPI000C7633E9|nr:aquaporin-9 [Eurytemora carolleeae]|eukprot:XP_023339108.1 aquaporin-9-like [Eurytemora affinis]
MELKKNNNTNINNIVVDNLPVQIIENKTKITFKELFKPKEFLGELLGTFILTVVTKGAVISLAVGIYHGELTTSSAHLPGCLASGLAVMMAILVTGGASGAQTNPAVSVTLWAAGKLSWTDLPAYLAGQYIGAGLGAGFILLNFRESIDGVGPECITSFPDLAITPFHLVFDQFLATFLLLSIVLSVDDQEHSPPGLLVGLSVAGIGLALGRNAGASMNPALDFMPRLVAAIWDSVDKMELDSDPFTPRQPAFSARKWDKTEDETCDPRKGEMGQTNLSFIPDVEKSTHFDGTICHRMATFY